jgi:hypothetical protein
MDGPWGKSDTNFFFLNLYYSKKYAIKHKSREMCSEINTYKGLQCRYSHLPKINETKLQGCHKALESFRLSSSIVL